MTLRNMQIFIAVAETGSMSRAAKKLYITQPSVSQAITELERTYNVVLFERRTRSLIPTPTGETLVRYAKKLLQAEQEIEDFLGHESLHPRIRIGATATVGACMMSGIVVELQKAVPGVVHHVCVANTNIIVEKLLKGDLDVALMEGSVVNPDLDTQAAIRDRLVLICANEHPFHARPSIDIHELNNVPLILSEIGSGTRTHFEELLRQNGVEENLSWGCYNFDAIFDAVKHNLGVGILSERLVREESAKGALHVCDILGVDLSCDFQLVYHKNKIFTDTLSRFSQICKDVGYCENAR